MTWFRILRPSMHVVYGFILAAWACRLWRVGLLPGLIIVTVAFINGFIWRNDVGMRIAERLRPGSEP